MERYFCEEGGDRLEVSFGVKSREEAFVDGFGEEGEVYSFSFECFFDDFILFVSAVGQIIESLPIEKLSDSQTVVEGFVPEPFSFESSEVVVGAVAEGHLIQLCISLQRSLHP